MAVFGLIRGPHHSRPIASQTPGLLRGGVCATSFQGQRIRWRHHCCQCRRRFTVRPGPTSGTPRTPGSTLHALKDGRASDEELAVAVEETSRWGCFVASHSHEAGGIKAAIRAGVRTIDNGSMMDHEAIEMLSSTSAPISGLCFSVVAGGRVDAER